jgi:tripartite-type tricarboxylate transporter receptor subunit TctC
VAAQLGIIATFAEVSLKEVEGTSWFAVYATAKTPAAAIQ